MPTCVASAGEKEMSMPPPPLLAMPMPVRAARMSSPGAPPTPARVMWAVSALMARSSSPPVRLYGVRSPVLCQSGDRLRGAVPLPVPPPTEPPSPRALPARVMPLPPLAPLPMRRLVRGTTTRATPPMSLPVRGATTMPPWAFPSPPPSPRPSMLMPRTQPSGPRRFHHPPARDVAGSDADPAHRPDSRGQMPAVGI